MSFLGKLRNAVLGNTVLRDYEMGKQVASAGPGLQWKVYAGVKRSNRQEVAIFVFNKQTPEFEKLSKKHRDTLVETLKRGPTQLAKLRHPKLLTIDHPVEDSADSIAFATEPITASLANLLGHHDNLPTPVPPTIKDYDLRPIEIQYGLLEVAEALAFLHDDVHMLHGNLSPESILLAKSGAWKLVGFEFSSYTQPQGDSLSVVEPPEWDSRNHILSNPRLEYLAPEIILSRARSEPSDFYSYGMTIYACYNGGRSVFDCQNNVTMFKQNAEQISRITEVALGNVPAEFKTLVRSTLSIDPSVRPDAQQITKHPFFEEVGANTLKYLDTLMEKTDMEKSQFFKKNLSRVITKLPKRVVNQRVLPALAAEFKNHKMIPFLLPLVFLLAEDYSAQEYTSLLWPLLVPVFLVQDPVQVPIILLQRMDLLLKKTSQEDVKKHVIPMILRAMEGGGATSNIQLQELCVSILPTFAGVMDYSSLKHSIVPRLVTTCSAETTSLGLLVKCLVALGKMLDHFDKIILVEQVIPMLEKIKSREPAVLMAILGIYHETVKNKKLGLDKNLLGTKIVPFLIPLAMEPVLKLSQFNQFMIVIEEMLYKVVTEQRAHLEQLAAMEQQTESTVAFSQEVTEAKAMDDALDKIASMSGKQPQGAAAMAGPLEVDDFFSLNEPVQRTSTRPQASPSSGQPLDPKPATQTSPLQPLSSLQPVPMASSLQPVPMASSLQPVPMASSLQPVPMTSSLQPVPMTSSLQPVPMASSLQPVPMTSSLQPVPMASSLQPVPMASAFDADFGPIEWSSASQPSGGQWSNGGPVTGPGIQTGSTGQYMQHGEGQSSVGAKGLFSGMEGRSQQSDVGEYRNAASSGQLQSFTGQVGGATTSGQANSGQLFSGMTTRPQMSAAASGMDWSSSDKTSFSNQFSSAPQTGQMYAAVQATGVRGGQQIESSYQQFTTSNQPASKQGSTKLEPTARHQQLYGQPLVPTPAQSSTPQQPQPQNVMGWSSGGSAQSSTPQQPQPQNVMGWSSGGSAQSSTPQQPQPQNVMGWSSGGSAQSSTPQQPQPQNVMGWSSGGSAQSSTPQQPQPQNVMGWSSGGSAQSSTPQQPQPQNVMGWSSGGSAQSSTPQQPQPQNVMGWSSGGSTQSSTPQQPQPQNVMGWSSGGSAQSSTPQQPQPQNVMGWSQQAVHQQPNSMAWTSQNAVPLRPAQQAGTTGSSVPSAQSQQWPTIAAPQTGQLASNRPLPTARDNPFADFLA